MSDSTKIAKLEAELKKDFKALEAAKAPASAIEAEIKEIEEDIANVGGVMLKAQKSKVTSLNNAMDKLRSNITKVICPPPPLPPCPGNGRTCNWLISNIQNHLI